MIKERAWPVRLMYLLIAAALAISLFIVAAPAQKVSGACTADVCAEWERVGTPTMDGFVLAPESTIYDYALASAGEVAYALVYGWDEEYANEDYRLLKSEDGAATWKDLTDKLDDVIDPDNEDLNYIDELVLVATDWEDPDFVAVALEWWDNDAYDYYLHVFFSTDGGDTFIDAGEVEDGGVYFDDPDEVADLVVSYEADGERDIAIGGMDNTGNSALFRCTVTGDNPGDWEDATVYGGWDDDGAFASALVTDLIFSPVWETDRTILAVTVYPYGGADGYWYGAVYLQSGVWGETSAAWNEDAGFAPAVLVIEDVYIPIWLMDFDARGIAGVALPLDYSGADTDTRVSWVWVNYFDETIPMSQGEIFRVRDDAVDSVDTQIAKMPWLTNVSYLGTIAEGKAIAGVLADSDDEPLYEDDLIKECCEGVQVYRNAGITNMEICCLEWDKACKPPTGRFAMAVSYVSEDKAYAVALGGVFDYEEGAWSVSFDDGDTWNQLSLIDTDIDYISDVAVSPDCNKTFIVTVNTQDDGEYCTCDSVWVHADEFPEAGYSEYSGHWLRTWCGQLEYDWGFLRLTPEETTGDTVYLVDYDTDTIYYNDLETLACWDRGTATIDNIVDLAVADEATIYALDYYGDVAMSDDHGKTLTWTDPVGSEVDYGYTIAVWGDDILVGSEDGEVSYSDDGGETFTALEKVADDGLVTVAFDTYFDQNDTIYAALADADGDNIGDYDEDNGIYLFVIGESENWFKLNAEEYDYTGLVLDRPSPANPMTSPETGGVLYASYIGEFCSAEWPWSPCDDACGDVCWYTGVARCLTPIVELCCGVGQADWDYLVVGLSDEEAFVMAPQALKICGCLTADSNSKLFAIDGPFDDESPEDFYDMDEAEVGTVWRFEDCYAKKQVELVSPDDGSVIGADPCYCANIPFTVRWERLCDACSYEVQVAYDVEFTDIFDTWHACDLLAPMTPSFRMWDWFTCEFTYYWRVRVVDAETCQWIRSWWSEPRSFTIAPSVAAAQIELVSPVPGALNVPVKNVGFSWDLIAAADEFDWVLSKNADLSNPVESKTGLSSTAYTCTKTLDYGTTYYWQVTAYKGGVPISISAVGTFTTAVQGAFCCPQCGLCFDTQAALQQHIDAQHPAQPAIPFWVWVVIAIGAVLVIVVIVLIFRTRRV